jgi:dihydrofolate synthase / folylpolyglutamate synthase
VLGRRIGADGRARAEGLALARWPGRLETIDTPEGPVLLDAAHNPDGAVALAAHLASTVRPDQRVALVFGVLADKAWGSMLDSLAGITTRRFYATPQGRAAVPLADFAARHPGEPTASVADAITRARGAVGRGGLVVVTGSIFLVGEARSTLLQLPRDPAVAL